MAERGPVFFSTVISYSLAYDATDVMNDNDLATVLSVYIKVSIALMDMVRKLSVAPIILAK